MDSHPDELGKPERVRTFGGWYHTYDKALYRERNLAERFFNKLKQFRRVATRYDKLLPSCSIEIVTPA